MFCYRKRHLHELGLKIASTCSCHALVEAAGTGGQVIFDQSRDPDATLAKENLPASHASPKPVTLANCIEFGDEDTDDEDDFDD